MKKVRIKRSVTKISSDLLAKTKAIDFAMYTYIPPGYVLCSYKYAWWIYV